MPYIGPNRTWTFELLNNYRGEQGGSVFCKLVPEGGGILGGSKSITWEQLPDFLFSVSYNQTYLFTAKARCPLRIREVTASGSYVCGYAVNLSIPYYYTCTVKYTYVVCIVLLLYHWASQFNNLSVYVQWSWRSVHYYKSCQKGFSSDIYAAISNKYTEDMQKVRHYKKEWSYLQQSSGSRSRTEYICLRVNAV